MEMYQLGGCPHAKSTIQDLSAKGIPLFDSEGNVQSSHIVLDGYDSGFHILFFACRACNARGKYKAFEYCGMQYRIDPRILERYRRFSRVDEDGEVEVMYCLGGCRHACSTIRALATEGTALFDNEGNVQSSDIELYGYSSEEANRVLLFVCSTCKAADEFEAGIFSGMEYSIAPSFIERCYGRVRRASPPKANTKPGEITVRENDEDPQILDVEVPGLLGWRFNRETMEFHSKEVRYPCRVAANHGWEFIWNANRPEYGDPHLPLRLAMARLLPNPKDMRIEADKWAPVEDPSLLTLLFRMEAAVKHWHWTRAIETLFPEGVPLLFSRDELRRLVVKR